MNEMIFLLVALGTLLFVIVLICLHLFQIFEEPTTQKKMRKLRKTTQPFVTILVYARSNEASIKASLKAILKSKYYNFDVVVVDDHSQDNTAQVVRDFIFQHSTARIALLKRRANNTPSQALQAGYKKSRRGEVVISLNADTIIDPSFIKRAVISRAEKSFHVMRVDEAVSLDSLNGITNTLRSLFWQRSGKVRVSGAKNIMSVKGQPHFNVLTILFFVMIFAAITLTGEAVLLWYAWVIVTGYLCAVIWLNEQSLSAKLKLTFSALPALFLLPVSSLFGSLSQFHSRN